MGDYPISSFLFWKVKEENKKDWTSYQFKQDFDEEHPRNIEANMSGINKDIYLVLDGQQRLTAMNIGLRGFYRYFHYKWRKTELYLNLLKPMGRNEENSEELEYQFQFRESNQPNDPNNELWYKVGRILDFMDSVDAMAGIKNEIAFLDEQNQESAKKLIGRLHTRVHTYKIVNYYEEKTQDYDKVVEVFIRANAAGKTLEYSDILLSTATAKWKNLNAREEIYNFTDDINAIRSGYSFGKDFILKGSLYLTDGLPIKYKVSNFTTNNLGKIEDNWPNIKSGIENTVKLIGKFDFNNKNITAAMALLPITYYLVKLNKKNYINSTEKNDVINQMSIMRWLILVLLKNSFGGSSDTTLSNLRAKLASIADYSKFPFVELNQTLGIEASFTDEEIENLLRNNYGTKYSYLILSLLDPDKDWKHYEEDHIFPKASFTSAKLKAKGYGDKKIEEYGKYFNTILNLQLLTGPENREKSATDFDSWINTRNNNFKERHGIPILDSYSFDSFINFIEERKKILQSKLKAI